MRDKVIECPVCGKQFKKTGTRQIYCSRQCRTKVMNEKRKIKEFPSETVTCQCCGEVVKRTSPKQKYCPDCAIYMREAQQKEWNEKRKNQRHAEIGMRNIKKNNLDERLAECRRRGISYSQLQQEETWRKIYKGEL